MTAIQNDERKQNNIHSAKIHNSHYSENNNNINNSGIQIVIVTKKNSFFLFQKKKLTNILSRKTKHTQTHTLTESKHQVKSK